MTELEALTLRVAPLLERQLAVVAAWGGATLTAPSGDAEASSARAPMPSESVPLPSVCESFASPAPVKAPSPSGPPRSTPPVTAPAMSAPSVTAPSVSAPVEPAPAPTSNTSISFSGRLPRPRSRPSAKEGAPRATEDAPAATKPVPPPSWATSGERAGPPVVVHPPGPVIQWSARSWPISNEPLAARWQPIGASPSKEGALRATEDAPAATNTVAPPPWAASVERAGPPVAAHPPGPVIQWPARSWPISNEPLAARWQAIGASTPLGAGAAAASSTGETAALAERAPLAWSPLALTFDEDAVDDDLEERLADALERAARDAGIDLT